MEDRAVAVAAAGGGEGGSDGSEDALWKCLAPPLSQSKEERRALRSEYAGVRAMIRDEVKDDPTLGQFDAAFNKIEHLHEKVQRPLEQVADAEALLDLSIALVSSTKVENRDGPTPSEFVTALISKFDASASPLVDSSESFSWSSLGCAVSGLFMTAAGCQTMNGPMGLGLTVKERRHAVRRQSGHLGSGPAEYPFPRGSRSRLLLRRPLQKSSKDSTSAGLIPIRRCTRSKEDPSRRSVLLHVA